MNRPSRIILPVLAAVLLGGCAYHRGGTDFSEIAERTGMNNITTGDGTFENYKATGHYAGTEVGIAIGIPFLGKIMELAPARSNEDLMTDIAQDAKEDGAESMINVVPNHSLYTGIPFIIIGVYVDKASGTGITTE